MTHSTSSGQAETRPCQNCKQNFIVEPEDFDFYKKMDVPAPTFCPQCRMQRRMTWRNERAFHKGKCAATGKDFLTVFAPEAGVTIYDRDYWWSDKWDQLDTGRDYDFNKPFFAQFAELMKQAPLPNLMNSNCINSEYGNHSLDCKNCYLFHASADTENSSYVTGAVKTKDSLDIYKMLNGTQCYEITLCGEVNRQFFSYDSDENVQCEFLFSSKNMQQSLGCVNMRNRSYCIFNKQYSKDDYQKERAKYDLGSYKQLQSFKENFSEFVKNYPRRYATVLKSVDVTGSHIINAKNSKFCFDGYGGIEDCKYICHGFTLKDSYDCYGAGRASELIYESIDTGAQASRVLAAVFTHGCQNTAYTYACHGSTNLFGCVGLRSKKYCIFNKQYSKEEYEKLVPEIIKHMKSMPYVDSKGRTYSYGEFFPVELSPFAYNETIAQEYAPFTKKNAVESGYPWRDSEEKHYAVTISADKLPDHIKDTPETILKETIGCAHKGECNHQCSAAFKIIPSELEFLKHFNLALPRLCPNCRHYERLAKRTPFNLWKRACQCAGEVSANGKYKNHTAHAHGAQPCGTEFDTPYSPERKETVYCEQCYQQEVV